MNLRNKNQAGATASFINNVERKKKIKAAAKDDRLRNAQVRMKRKAIVSEGNLFIKNGS